jgi:mRNA interferase MazF
MKRGDIYSICAPGEFGKPRPAVIVQTDALNRQQFSSVIICPFTGAITDAPLFRILVEPTPANGLTKKSQIMVDKVLAVPVKRIGEHIGQINDEQILQLNRTLAFVIGIG